MGKRKMVNIEPHKRVSKRPRGSQRKKETLNDYDLVSPLDYVTSGGFHFVRPYAFEFRTTYKPRFENRTVLAVFCDEFRHVNDTYWPREFSQGRVLLLDPHTKVGSPLSSEELWRSGMVVVHIVHRHESAVPAVPIDVVVDEKDFIVVSKPAGMPVHPSGTYRRNTLQFLLRAFPPAHVAHNGPLFIVHRLDKETSGLVILAKTSAAAARFGAEIRDHLVQKLYLAHVHGVISSDEIVCEGCIIWDSKRMRSRVEHGGLTAQTKFRRLAFDARTNTSVVECRPLTGRTHQIRVHLAHLGHPIVSDTLYGGHNLVATTTTLTTRKPKPAIPSGIMTSFLQTGLHSLATIWSGGSEAGQAERHAELSDTSKVLLTDASFIESNELLAQNKSFMACPWAVSAREGRERLSSVEEGALLECSNCPQVTNVKNVERVAMQIRLHALQYRSEQWNFEVGLPSWMPDWYKGERSEAGGGKKKRQEDTGGVCADKHTGSGCVVM